MEKQNKPPTFALHTGPGIRVTKQVVIDDAIFSKENYDEVHQVANQTRYLKLSIL